MQHFRILGMALMVVFALGAVVSATASAEVVILPLLTAEEKWTGVSGLGTLEVLPGGIFHQIVCTKDKTEGTFEAKKPLGLFHITLEGCKNSGSACTGLGDASGVILLLGTFHLVFDKLGAGVELGVGMLFLLESVHLTCFSLLTVTGQLLCLIKPNNTKVKHWEIVCKGAKGDPGETEYWNETGTQVKIGEEILLLSENEGVSVMGNLETEELILTISSLEIMG